MNPIDSIAGAVAVQPVNATGVKSSEQQSSAGMAATSQPAAGASQTQRAVQQAGRSGQAQQHEQMPFDMTHLQEAVNEMARAIEPVAQNLRFSIDEDTGKTVVKVVDTHTDEVIRQIPSEELIAISRALNKLQGVLLHQEA